MHGDVADACNVMVFTSDAPDGSPGSAHWDVLAHESMGVLQEYLRAKKNAQQGVHNPIHSQSVFLTPGDIQELREKYGVLTYSFEQYLGDAVIIPAGCPHQVRLCHDMSAIRLMMIRSPIIRTASR